MSTCLKDIGADQTDRMKRETVRGRGPLLIDIGFYRMGQGIHTRGSGQFSGHRYGEFRVENGHLRQELIFRKGQLYIIVRVGNNRYFSDF